MTATQSRSTTSSTHLHRFTILARWTHQTLPGFVHQQALSTTLNHVFGRALKQGELDFMRGRRVRIVVPDIHLDFSVTLLAQRLYVSMKAITTDVTFRANLHDLLRVIAGQVDPDTLFFRRKLAIEGNTELGLALKNFLDGQAPEELMPTPVYRLVTHLASA
ncbi:ubiquinone anaerobic biosynthesis accessory factor UbiT [Marinimicrobium agarilyticum]|uniref:ubiquinone anaerobic biosynthesis accessory factor UbiT n=1 Tax=Marinimicrobium agarilyticum TaxID=306546 RepID=UPI0003F73B0C|nr:SCP2 sterol-binding domain-containing protein [Marinimicrobium agarilyticum]